MRLLKIAFDDINELPEDNIAQNNFPFPGNKSGHMLMEHDMLYQAILSSEFPQDFIKTVEVYKKPKIKMQGLVLYRYAEDLLPHLKFDKNYSYIEFYDFAFSFPGTRIFPAKRDNGKFIVHEEDPISYSHYFIELPKDHKNKYEPTFGGLRSKISKIILPKIAEDEDTDLLISAINKFKISAVEI
jgi:hypothetical protein